MRNGPEHIATTVSFALLASGCTFVEDHWAGIGAVILGIWLVVRRVRRRRVGHSSATQ